MDQRPDLLEAISAEIAALASDPRHPLRSSGPGRLSLGARHVDIAAHLYQRYGTAIHIEVGNRPFPPERIVPGPLRPLGPSDSRPTPLRCEIELSDDTVPAGDDLTGSVILHNSGGVPVEINYGGDGLSGGVRLPGETHWAGVSSYTIVTLVMCRRIIEPGEESAIPLRIGTTSLLPDRSYAVPPGRYEPIVTLSYAEMDD